MYTILEQQIGGTTLHTFAGIGSGEAPIATCLNLARRKAVAAQWRACRHLIIDEVSMIDGNFFKKLEAVARDVRYTTSIGGWSLDYRNAAWTEKIFVHRFEWYFVL